MTLAEIQLVRDGYLKSCKNLTVTVDENMTFDNREAFMIWDDADLMLKIIGPNHNYTFINAPERRIEVYCIPYDRIIWINSVPDTRNIDTLLADMKITGDTAEVIKTRVSQLSDINSFMVGDQSENSKNG